MATYQRPQRQQKEDPLQTALQIYQMFQQPQQGDELKLVLDLQQQQTERDIQQQQFAQEQALREQTAANEQAYRTGSLDIQNRELAQKGAPKPLEIDAGTMQGLVNTLTSPDATGAQKIGAREMLLSTGEGKRIVQQIDAEQAALARDVAGGGAGAAQPAPSGPLNMIGFGQPMAGGGPVALGQDLGAMLMSLFKPKAPGAVGEAKKRVMQPTYSEGRAPNY